MNSTKKQLRLLPFSKTIIPVDIHQELIDKIRYLCKLIPREEWSGVLFYDVEGSIKDIKNFRIILKDVYPMNKGTAGFTSYEFDEKLIGYRMDNPESLMWSIGHIHSHNSMNTFFSGTDNDELTDNAPNHNYYLSVIVNNYLDFSIRVAFLSATETFLTKDEDGNLFEIKTEPMEVVFYYNAEIKLPHVEIKVVKTFEENVKNIIKDAEKRQREHELKQKQVFNKAQKANQKQLPFHAPADDAELMYDAFIEAFTIELLGQNTPIVLGDSLDVAIERLVKGVEPENYSNFVASLLTDYPDLYSMTFGNPADATTFMEDLDAMLTAFTEAVEKNGTDSELMNMIIEGLQTFAEEFENVNL